MTGSSLVLTAILAIALATVSAGTQSGPGEPPRPGFHHLHMNSPDPSAAVDAFMKLYPASTKVTVAGFTGIRSANGVTMLFTKVTRPAPAPGPGRVSAAAPQTAFWHHVWSVTDARATLRQLRAADPTFDRTKFIPQLTGPDGATVDFSSDTLSGFLTTGQLEAARKAGRTPTHRGGYFNWYGPDGVVMETSDQAPEAYRIVGMFQDQPYCAVFWYRKHLNAADRPANPTGAGGGRGGPPPSDGPTSEAACNVTRGSDVSWPSTYERGHFRTPPAQSVYYGDVQLRWYMNQEERPLASTRGQLLDHLALGVTGLDAWVAKLRREGVTFLEQPYRFGDTRAVMIEGPGKEAIELVETK
jgi:hypothetical protein